MQQEEGNRGENMQTSFVWLWFEVFFGVFCLFCLVVFLGALSGKPHLPNIIICWGHPAVNTVVGPAPC